MMDHQKIKLCMLFLAGLCFAAPAAAGPGDIINESNALGVNVDSPNEPAFKVRAVIKGVANQAVTADLLVPAKRITGAGSLVVNKNEITYISGTEADFNAILEVRSVANPSICRSYPVRIDSGCVQEGTLVSMADGSKKAIEAIVPGEKIVAYDTEAKRTAEATVQKVLMHDEITYLLHEIAPEGGEPLLATGNHPILTRDAGWQQVDNLRAGDVIYHYDILRDKMVEMKIAAIIRDKSEKGVVYNLKTSRGNYIANDLLIHNKCLKRGSSVETPSGVRAIDSLLPGDLVMGEVNGAKTPVKVTNVYMKETMLPALPGKRLSAQVTATVNHVLLAGGRKIKAGETSYPDEAVSGAVFDIKTESSNYFADGLLLLEEN